MKIIDILNGFIRADEDWKIGKSNYWILANKEELNALQNKIVFEERNLDFNNVPDDSTSKIVFFDSCMFLRFNILAYRNEIIKSRELDIYLGKDYILTVYNNKITVIRELIEDIINLKNCFILKKNPKPAMVLYYILDRIIVKNYEIMSIIEEKADKIEMEILEKPSRHHADDLIHLRRQLYRIRKFLNPMRYIGDSLVSNDNSVIEENDIKYFKNINIKINKLMNNLESLVQNLALVREAFESEISNKTNEFMKVFTIITSIFLPLELISGVQGMNFKNMPFSRSIYGYYYTIVLMIIVTCILISIFKIKKWL
ncbi:magnesium transporter CorA family protein [Clostridium botulinum]|uniref:magnesium transporter CorA family protein n=3 Tax=Clostridium botulinum TaxID=1491 RepID=UPI00069A7B40|nr:magnesium transporter CorA family protein [Clostridium botulinum]MCD3203219.1 magnesium transporter CorA family protein [Clostridium botulinum C/D]KOA78429.1 dihydroorotate dehydrogenase [Clostridium botulinum]KOA93750.1 dihydroorotate dehydrogenase [Clostridium botulinum]KOC33732.1 dihydroorotate dehydrogenase [Clostridium botulinum]MCD3221846.1 magnesium transporter CorA family protein [Clostridium botulinum C/D]